jgi:hypothetical protein
MRKKGGKKEKEAKKRERRTTKDRKNINKFKDLKEAVSI